MAVLTSINSPFPFPFHFPTKFSIKKTTLTLTSIQSTNNNKFKFKFTRRTSLKLASNLFLLPIITTSREAAAAALTIAFDFRITVPVQTWDEAETGIREHAENLLKVKDLLRREEEEEEGEGESNWKAAQKALRKNSAYLKQDIYTIIQSKPGSERSELRKMYSVLFNGVSSLDYALRDKDVPRVWECYHNVALALYNILDRISSQSYSIQLKQKFE